MAGIGFELRKIFNKKSLYSKVKGFLYATMTTVGPTVVFLCMLLTVTFGLQYFGATGAQQIFFSSACLYVFLICILISGGMGTIMSRFISDRIHESEEEFIPSALLGSSFFVCVITAVFAGILTILLYLYQDVDILFLLFLYLLAIMVSITYNAMVFISALKEYTKITLAFLCGIFTGILFFLCLHILFKVDLLLSTIISMTTIFLTINIILHYLVITYFHNSNTEYFAFIKYFKKYPFIAMSGFFYMLGLYIPNILYWYLSEISVQVGILRVAPSYDMALFLAVIVNLTTPVIFVVNVETKFFEKYRVYTGSLISATYETIEKHRKIMLRTLDVELFFIYEIQLIITIILSCLGILVLPLLGFGGLVLNFFLVLAVAIYTVYLMYFTTVFLYYFDDQFGSFLTTAVFLAVTVISTTFALFLGIAYYPVALLVGGIISWLVGFLRLKFFLSRINSRLFCREAR